MDILAFLIILGWVCGYFDAKLSAERAIDREQWKRYYRRNDVRKKSTAHKAIVKLRAKRIRKIRNQRFMNNKS